MPGFATSDRTLDQAPEEGTPLVDYVPQRYLESVCSDPLAGQDVWTGIGGHWGRTIIDLSSMGVIGTSMRIRFTFGLNQFHGSHRCNRIRIFLFWNGDKFLIV